MEEQPIVPCTPVHAVCSASVAWQVRQADDDVAHVSSAPVAAQSSAMQQSGGVSQSHLLMNGQAESMRHLEPEAASQHPLQPGRLDHPNSSSNGVLDTDYGGLNSRPLSSRDAEFLGQQTLDFWLNLCICHTLIVEQDKSGGLPVYQVHICLFMHSDAPAFASHLQLMRQLQCYLYLITGSSLVASAGGCNPPIYPVCCLHCHMVCFLRVLGTCRVLLLMRWHLWKVGASWALSLCRGIAPPSRLKCWGMR